MHTSGKVLLGFVVVGWIVAIMFSSKTLAIRNYWHQKLAELEKENQQLETQVVAKRMALRKAKGEFTREVFPWERHWSDLSGRIDAKGGQFEELGSDNQLQEGQVLYAFGVQNDGSSSYLGSFKVTTLRENQVGVSPTWRIREGDIARSFEKFRVRTMIPTASQAYFDEAERRLLLADELIIANQRELKRQEGILAGAEEHLSFRLQQINGNPELKGKTVPPEDSEGLLATLISEDEKRNVVVAEVDQLLRKLKSVREKRTQVQQQNNLLMRSLPSQSAPPSNVSSR